VAVTDVCISPATLEAINVTICVLSVSVTVTLDAAGDVETNDQPAFGVTEMTVMVPPADDNEIRAALPTWYTAVWGAVRSGTGADDCGFEPEFITAPAMTTAEPVPSAPTTDTAVSQDFFMVRTPQSVLLVLSSNSGIGATSSPLDPRNVKEPSRPSGRLWRT
jgi:hypothetical protein